MTNSMLAPRVPRVDADALAQLTELLAPSVLPTGDDLGHLAGVFPVRRRAGQDEHLDAVGFRTEEGRTFRLELGLGVAACRSFDATRRERAADRERSVRRRDADLFAAAAADDGTLPSDDWSSGREVTAWSAKSRSNMVRTLASLDYLPLTSAPGGLAVVTLTYWGYATVGIPDESWVCSAPRGSVAGAHLRSYQMALAKVYGPQPAVWKQEFQDRGAPHWHLLQAIPLWGPDEHRDPRGHEHELFIGPLPRGVRRWRLCCQDGDRGCARVRNVHEGPLQAGRSRASLCACGSFHLWLARTWSRIVRNDADTRVCLHKHDHDSLQRRHEELHLRDKVISFSDASTMTDHRRIAVYFLKHSAKSSGAKEYQHRVPAAWRGTGDGPGRFWGYWVLEKPLVSVDVDEEDYYVARRTLRRAANARRGLIAYQRAKHEALQAGAAPAESARAACAASSPPVRSFGVGGQLSGGWHLLNDGVRFGLDLARYLRDRGL